MCHPHARSRPWRCRAHRLAPRFAFAFAFAAGPAAKALLAGIPTDVIPNGVFTRMTPVRGYDVPALVAVSVLGGLSAAARQPMRSGCSAKTTV